MSATTPVHTAVMDRQRTFARRLRAGREIFSALRIVATTVTLAFLAMACSSGETSATTDVAFVQPQWPEPLDGYEGAAATGTFTLNPDSCVTFTSADGEFLVIWPAGSLLRPSLDAVGVHDLPDVPLNDGIQHTVGGGTGTWDADDFDRQGVSPCASTTFPAPVFVTSGWIEQGADLERVGIEALERFQPGDTPEAEVVVRTVDEQTVEVEFNTGPICSSDLLSIEPVSVVASYDAETVQIAIDPTLTCDGDSAEFRSGVRLTLDEVIADRELRVTVDRRG